MRAVVCVKFLTYICTAFSGRGGIGRRARLRIWCLTAWGFESLRPHSRKITALLYLHRDKQAVFINLKQQVLDTELLKRFFFLADSQ